MGILSDYGRKEGIPIFLEALEDSNYVSYKPYLPHPYDRYYLTFPRIDGHKDKVYIEKLEVSEWERDEVTTSNSRLMRYV